MQERLHTVPVTINTLVPNAPTLPLLWICVLHHPSIVDLTVHVLPALDCANVANSSPDLAVKYLSILVTQWELSAEHMVDVNWTPQKPLLAVHALTNTLAHSVKLHHHLKIHAQMFFVVDAMDTAQVTKQHRLDINVFV
jgi:hypothetical protein